MLLHAGLTSNLLSSCLIELLTPKISLSGTLKKDLLLIDLVPEFLIQRTFQGGKLEMMSNQYRMSVTEPGSSPGGELSVWEIPE